MSAREVCCALNAVVIPLHTPNSCIVDRDIPVQHDTQNDTAYGKENLLAGSSRSHLITVCTINGM